MTSFFKISDDSINLMPTPIQTIIQDLQDNDKLVKDSIVPLYTPETSPLHYNDMTMSQPAPENALELLEDQQQDILQYPHDQIDHEILRSDEQLESEFGSGFEFEEIEQCRGAVAICPESPPDSEVQLATENSAKIDRHVSQIAEKKPEYEWESFICDNDQRQFLPQNVSTLSLTTHADQSPVQLAVQMYKEPQITSVKMQFFNEAVFERTGAKPESSRFVFVNTMDAKRENQRQTRFGVAMESDAMDRVPLGDLRLAVWLSLPGVYNRLTTCPTHARKVTEKYQHDDFMKVQYMNQEVTAKIARGTIVALDNHPDLWVMPLPKNGDRDAIELSFYCYSSCLKKGNAKEKLQLNVAILDDGNKVIERDHQFIRVTANPQRDAGIWPESTGGGVNSKQPRKQGTTKRMPMKQSRNVDSDEDYVPGKRIKREPVSSPPPAFIELHEQHSLATNASFNRLVDMAPVDKQDEVRAQLLRMHSSERNNFIAQEQERFWSNLQTSLKFHHQPRP